MIDRCTQNSTPRLDETRANGAGEGLRGRPANGGFYLLEVISPSGSGWTGTRVGGGKLLSIL